MCQKMTYSIGSTLQPWTAVHQQGAECEPLEGEPLNIIANAQALACGCKSSKITTLACAVTIPSDHKKREALAYCQGLRKPHSRPGCKNLVCQKKNDILHWVNNPTLDVVFSRQYPMSIRQLLPLPNPILSLKAKL